MRMGIAVSGPFDTLGALAKRCEDAGYESLWVPETARTAYLQAAVVAGATTRARVGTSIALAFPRSPVITAMEARDLAELSNGRFLLGLGTQVKRVNEFRYSTPFDHPAPRMRELMEVCRALWAAYGGAPIDHQGRFYTVTMGPFPGAGPPPGPIPIYLAAVNEMMVRLTGEMADGLLTHPFSSPRFLTEVAKPALEAGIKEAGRDPSEVEIVQSVITSVAETTEDALRGAKMQIGFYGTTRTYRGVFDIHGWGDVVDPLRAAFARGDFEAMIDLITDEMAETYSVSGTPDEVKDKMKRWDGLADTIVLNPPWASPSLVRTTEAYDAMLETFAPAR